MGRLTAHCIDEYVPRKLNLDFDVVMNMPQEEWEHFKDIIDKLAHYEDLEEQGRLIELDKQHCDWCDKGAELCGTCRKFFDYHNDGGSDKCSAECKEGACLNYEPMNYCPNCGAKMLTKEEAEAKLKELKEGVE